LGELNSQRERVCERKIVIQFLLKSIGIVKN
jgi:hypothetical protein